MSEARRVMRRALFVTIVVLIVGSGLRPASAALEEAEGTFLGNTYKVAHDPEIRNGDLFLLIPELAGLHDDDDQRDNRIVDAHLDLVTLGYTVASMDSLATPGLRLTERPSDLHEFAMTVRANLGLDGDVFVAGAPGTGTIVHLMLQDFPGSFAGGIADSGLAEIEPQLDRLELTLLEDLWTFRNDARETLESILVLQDMLDGPVVDRDTLITNSRLRDRSPAQGTAALADREILVHGDSDLRRPVFHHWLYTDAVVDAGRKNHMISFVVPVGGDLAPGTDVQRYYGDLLLELVGWAQTGTPPQYESGRTYGPRDDSDEDQPTTADVSEIDLMSATGNPVSISLQARAGQGSHLAGLNDSLRLRDLDGDGSMEILFGDHEGFVHVFELSQGELTERWRYQDLGAATFALDAGVLREGGAPRILVGNYSGQVYRLLPQAPYTVELIWEDPLGSPILDLEIVNLSIHEGPSIAVRTLDGYIHAIDPTDGDLVARSPYLGPTPGMGMDIADIDEDGFADIVVGDGRGFVRRLSSHDLSVVEESDALGIYPWRVHYVNTHGSSSPEVLVSGSKSADRQDESMSLVLNRSLSVVKSSTRLASYQGFAAADADSEGVDDLFLGELGRLCLVNLPGKDVQIWDHPGNREQITGVVTGDVEANGAALVVVVTAEGSVSVLERETLFLRAHRPGIAGGYGLALTELRGTTATSEVLVGRRPNGLMGLDGETLDPVSAFAAPAEWAHAIEVENVDGKGQREWIVGTGNGVEDTADELSGFVYALRNDGSTLWTTRNPELPLDNVDGSIWGLEVAEFNFDSRPEILIANDATPDHGLTGSPVGKAQVRMLDGATENVLASVDIDAHDLYGLAVGDVTGDSQRNVVVGDRRGYIHILSPADPVTSLEETYVSRDFGSSIVGLSVLDLDAAPPAEIVCGTREGVVRVLRWNGTALDVVAESAKLGSHTWGVFTGDIDGNGTREIVVGNANGDLYIFDNELNLLMTLTGLGSFLGAYDAMRVEDTDADGYQELVVGSSGYVYLFELRNQLTSAGRGTPPIVGGDPTGYDHAPPPPNPDL